MEPNAAKWCHEATHKSQFTPVSIDPGKERLEYGQFTQQSTFERRRFYDVFPSHVRQIKESFTANLNQNSATYEQIWAPVTPDVTVTGTSGSLPVPHPENSLLQYTNQYSYHRCHSVGSENVNESDYSVDN